MTSLNETYLEQGYVIFENLLPLSLMVDLRSIVDNLVDNAVTLTTSDKIYEILDEDEFHETFELAGHGKPWACFLTNEFKRVIDE